MSNCGANPKLGKKQDELWPFQMVISVAVFNQHLGPNVLCIVEGNHSWVFLCWPSFRRPWEDLVWETPLQITAIPNPLSKTVTVGPSVFQIRRLWRCSLGLSGVHLTEVIFHVSCQPGLEGLSGSLSAARGEDVVDWVVVPVEMFSGWHDWSRNHILPLGTNKRGLCGDHVASDRPEGGSNKFKLHSSSTINWPFSPLKGCHIAPGYVFTQLFVFATFPIDCRLFSNWPAAIILTQLRGFQFWLFVFIFVILTEKCAARWLTWPPKLHSQKLQF